MAEGVAKLPSADELGADNESSAFATLTDEIKDDEMSIEQQAYAQDFESEDEMDKKPAAIENSAGSESDSSSDSLSDEDKTKPKHVDSEGRKLSEYEIRRLERIRRNKLYLSGLGLESKDGGGVLGKKKKSSQKTRKKPKIEEVLPKRERSARLAKEQRKSYAEPPASVRDLIASTKPARKNEGEPKKEKPDRLEAFIHKEFRRIRSSKTTALKNADRNLKAVVKEMNYWQNQIPKLERRYQRQMEALKAQETEATERNAFGGLSTKELLQTIDSNMTQIQEAIAEYDGYWKGKNKENQREFRKSENERKLKLLTAVDRYPKAIKNATSLLNAVLVERAPKDPPPPRRSKRSSVADEDEEPETPTKKPAAKHGTKTQPAEDSPVGDEYSGLAVMPVVPSTEVELEEPGERTTRTGRKRNVRNVGGWVSPQFSAEIDRSWLTQDTAPAIFNLTNYVPQVGDLVLYYISGHRLYLEQYPDVLGKKIRAKTRVPLWERAAQLKAEQEEAEEQDAKSDGKTKSWWTPEWLEGLENDGLGDYPLICRVERTHAEFPPDPWIKVVKKDAKTDETKLYFKTKVYVNKPKNKADSSANSGHRLRLSVTLRPMTPLVAPLPNEDSSEKLEVPPLFSCVTFPCEQEPFIVPFSWAYARTHALSLNQKVLVGSHGKKVRVDSFSSSMSFMSLENKSDAIDSILAAIDSTSKNAYLEKELANSLMPVRDASVVLDVWRSTKKESTDDQPKKDAVEGYSFMEVLQGTLPIWRSVSSVENNDRNKMTHSPWLLLPVKRTRDLSSPWTIGSHSFVLDPQLRTKLVGFLDDAYDQNEAIRDLFYNPVTEEDAPSYLCAVPAGMAVSNIRMRLEGDEQDNRHHGYYRTIDAVLSDISTIIDCCLLYNNPESDLVREASKIVKILKDGVTKVAQDHSKEVKEARKQDEERRQVALQHSQVVGSTESRTVRLKGSFKLRKPVKDLINRSWVEGVVPQDKVQFDDGAASAVALCPFQVGDKVEYSRKCHSQFVKGHFPSLESEQCILLHTNVKNGDVRVEPESDRDNDWVRGQVLWARAAFPKALSKQSGDDACTFQSNALLQCVGVKFDSSDEVHVIFWRPCFIGSDPQPCPSSCPTCKLRTTTSFLKMSEAEPKESEGNDIIDEFVRDSIDGCLCLLKKRCIRGEIPEEIDNDLTKDNVKAGYVPASAKVSKKTLPHFDQLFGESPAEEETEKPHGTRGVPKKSKKDCGAVSPLLDAGFLPRWVLPARGGSVDNQTLAKLESMLPSARISLELVHQRVLHGYYRRKSAAQNDIIESYVCMTFMLLCEVALKKKDPVSIKKVARLLSAKKDNAEGSLNCTDEEIEWARQLRYVRSVHAAALVSVSDTDHVERVFGLLNEPVRVAKPDDLKDEDPDRLAAREKLGVITRALGKDELLNEFPADGKDPHFPVVKVRMLCGGKDAEFNQDTDYHIPTVSAKYEERDVKVRMICEGRPIFFGNLTFTMGPEEIPPKTRTKKNGVALHRRTKPAPPLYLQYEDYERSQEFQRRMIQRPGRESACARCKAYGRSALVCRRQRRHSNPDFDWVSEVHGGIAYIVALLKQLNPESHHADLVTKKISEQGLAFSAESGVQMEEMETEREGAGNENETELDGPDNDQEMPDARKMIEEAEELRTQCMEIFRLAHEYANAPDRLTKEFIDGSFPVDESDDHLIYCVVCGISGDLLCCDGCSNVVHLACMPNAPSELPEGDWFCDECIAKKESEEGSGRTISHPFGRVEFDFEKLELATQELNKLREARQSQKRRKSVGEENSEAASLKNASNEDDDGADNDMTEKESVNNERSPRKRQEPLKRRNGTVRNEPESSEEEEPYGESRSGRKRRRPQYFVERGTKRSRRSGEDDSPSPPPKRSRKSQDKDGRRSSAEVESSDPYESLSATTKEFLRSVDVNAAEELLMARSSDLAEKFRVWRIAKGMPELKGSGNVASISGWKSIVRTRARDLGMDELAGIEPNSIGSKSAADQNSDDSEEEGPERRRRRSTRQTNESDSETDRRASTPEKREGPGRRVRKEVADNTPKGRRRRNRRSPSKVNEDSESDDAEDIRSRRYTRGSRSRESECSSEDAAEGRQTVLFDPVKALASEESPSNSRRSQRSRRPPRRPGDLVEGLEVIN